MAKKNCITGDTCIRGDEEVSLQKKNSKTSVLFLSISIVIIQIPNSGILDATTRTKLLC